MCKEKSIIIIVGSHCVSLNKENILKSFEENDTILPVLFVEPPVCGKLLAV